MSNPTSNFNWQMPTATDLVTDLPADFEVFGQAVDTSLADLKGGTTGQVLSKTSGLTINGNGVYNQSRPMIRCNLATGAYGFDRWQSDYQYNTTFTQPAGQSVHTAVEFATSASNYSSRYLCCQFKLHRCIYNTCNSTKLSSKPNQLYGNG
jgi:hypothetical protein